jgi:cytidylate kinase
MTLSKRTEENSTVKQQKRQHHPFKIAVDGPAASGKGTLAKKLAEALGLEYLDTGKLYRAVGYALLYHADFKQIDDDPNAFAAAAISAAKTLDLQDINNTHLYDEGVGNIASRASAISQVREALLAFQKNFLICPAGAVLDGRDIGTVICPEADYKFFITAEYETRAVRRFKQLQKDDKNIIYDNVLQDLLRRDKRDSERSIAPLVAADDAVSIDTTSISAEEVLQKVLSYIR